MNDLSLYLLDLVQNSLSANATRVDIVIEEAIESNQLRMTITDNGDGMDELQLKKTVDPFYTTRTSRAVGLGIPFIKMACELADGSFEITSQKNMGTKLIATFDYHHINTPPLGNLEETVYPLLIHPQLSELTYMHVYHHKSFKLEKSTIMKLLDGVPMTEGVIMQYLITYIKESIAQLRRLP